MVTPAYSPRPTGRFDLSDVAPRARSLIRGTKGTAFLLAILSATAALVVAVASELATAPGGGLASPARTVANILSGLVTVPFQIAFMTLGLHRAAGRRPTAAESFERLDRMPEFLAIYLVCALPYLVIRSLWGAQGEWAAMPLSALAAFAGYYVLDQDLGPLAAIGRSVRFVVRNVGQLVLYLLLALALGALGCLTLGIGLIWITPFLVIAQALMYAHAEGLHRFDRRVGEDAETRGPA